jgi:biopolymer transport protein ExbD
MSKAREQEPCTIDMTPMIDCVFQLIIFFIVTINMSESKDPDVRLEMGPHGQEIETEDATKSALVIDVSSRGRISIGNLQLTQSGLQKIVRGRRSRYGNNTQIWIRGDARASHEMVRRVMDVCTEIGIGRVSFVAVKDPRTPEQKQFFESRRRSRGGR